MESAQPVLVRLLVAGSLLGASLRGASAPTLCAAEPPPREASEPVGHWRPAGEMRERREYGGGVRLRDGRILAVSGHPLEGRAVASAELYDPATESWASTGSLRQARNSGNSAVLLPDGRVLLAGGISGQVALQGAEIFDPRTGLWSDAGQLDQARDAKAIVLADGRVLVCGGVDWSIGRGKAFDHAELYVPTTGRWSTTGSMHNARYAHQLELLGDGRVLAVGGYRDGDVLLPGAELYDPSAGTWSLAAEPPSTRVAFGLVKLADGRVLLAGGFTGTSWKDRSNVASAAVFDPDRSEWTEVAPMGEKRAGLAMIVLPGGQVLATGGWAQNQLEFKSAELFDPAKGTWRPAAPMLLARRNHRAALLPDGSVLVLGGSAGFGNQMLTSCEIFTLSEGASR